MPPSLSITVSERSAPVVITLTGEFDLAGQEAFESVLLPIWKNPSPGIVLDLTGLTFMDSSGIKSVMQFRQRCAHARRSLDVRVSEPVLHVLRLTGLTGILGIEDAQTE